MSFDLYFCTKTDIPVAKEDIFKFLVHFPHTTNEWTYQNPRTGVYFSFLYSPEPENGIETVILSGYKNTNLSFNINYLRPKFFADEAMPYVEQLCNAFGFLIVDPQSQEVGGTGLPKRAITDNLIESWTRSNQRAMMAYKQQRSLPPYLPREISMEWWKYQFHRDGIADNLGDSIYVPNILLFAGTEDNRVKTAIVWTEAIPFVFPRCDMVIIATTSKKGLFRSKAQVALRGWIDAATVKDELSQYVQNIETEIGLLSALLPEKSSQVKTLFTKIKTSPIPKKFTRIAPDSMIDDEIS